MHTYRSFVATLTSLALALQAPLSALAAGADFAPAISDDIARRCDVFASVYDAQYTGPRTALDEVTAVEAIRVCARAAEARPVRSRYVYLYGTALLAAKRYSEAARQFNAARQAGNLLRPTRRGIRPPSRDSRCAGFSPVQGKLQPNCSGSVIQSEPSQYPRHILLHAGGTCDRLLCPGKVQ